MAHHNTGLQPLNLVMTLAPFLFSSIVVGVRVWKKLQKRSFAAGMIYCRLSNLCSDKDFRRSSYSHRADVSHWTDRSNMYM